MSYCTDCSIEQSRLLLTPYYSGTSSATPPTQISENHYGDYGMFCSSFNSRMRSFSKGGNMMALITPKCMMCNKEIQHDEEVFVQIRYPKQKGFTEIKAYLNIEGKFICKECSPKISI